MKKIKIGLIPSDFIGNSYINSDDCALTRAAKRYFGTTQISCNAWFLTLYDNKQFDIVDTFNGDDFRYVKEQYAKDPNMLEVQYEVTLIER